MKRVITLLFVAFIALSALAQDRKLTVAEAVFHAVQDPSSEMGYRLLSPETLDNLQWIEGTDLYLYSKGDTYEIFNPKVKKWALLAVSSQWGLSGCKATCETAVRCLLSPISIKRKWF